MNRKLVVLSGAGISAESGIKTFRDAGGLWEGYDVQAVATPEGWHANPQLVLNFYNQRRRDLHSCEPNHAHRVLHELEDRYDVDVITQNVDDLHERAGSSKVLHLHGELLKVRSESHEQLVYDWSDDLHLGDLADDGSQLRPHIVWFGEAVPAMDQAVRLVEQADLMLIIGTSMQVYPAASLIHFMAPGKPIYIIDPKRPHTNLPHHVHFIEATATQGVDQFVDMINKFVD